LNLSFFAQTTIEDLPFTFFLKKLLNDASPFIFINFDIQG